MPNVLLYACKYFILNKPDDAIDVDITCVVFVYLFENVVMVPTDHDIPFSRTFQGLLRSIFKDFSRTFLCSFKHPFEKKINNGLFK